MQTFVDFIRRLGFTFIAGNQLNVLALKGASVDGKKIVLNSDKSDKYNDLLVCIMGNNVEYLIGTVDPGLYFMRKPSNSRGTAHIALTQHAFVKGTHRSKPALRARNEKIWLMRDYNRDFRYSEGDILEVGIGTGLNIHAGGPADKDVGRWSAGCLNIADGWNGKPWKKFMTMVNDSNQDFYPITVWSARDYLRYVDNKNGFKPTLHFGCIQREVSDVQTRVGAIAIDDIFGSGTVKAVKKFQESYNLVPDGIVGIKTWAKLIGA